jgi:hypothetical protein
MPDLLMSFMIVISMQLALAPEVGFIVAGSLYACIWIPPIIRAMRRGRSCGLSAEYLIGTTIGRVMFITCERENTLSHEQSFLT